MPSSLALPTALVGPRNLLIAKTQVIAGDHKTIVYQKENIPAPAVKATFEVGSSSPVQAVRHAAMNALVSVRGDGTAI